MDPDFKNPDTDRRKNPDPSGSQTLTVCTWLHAIHFGSGLQVHSFYKALQSRSRAGADAAEPEPNSVTRYQVSIFIPYFILQYRYRYV